MAVDMFIQIDGVKGESMDHKHKGEIDVLSWSWSMTQSGTFHVGGGGGSGKVNIGDLVFTKWVDKSSPNLMQICCEGEHIPSALLTIRKAGKNPLEYMKITFEKLLVSAVTTGGEALKDDRLLETIKLNFAKFKVEYQEQDEKGGPKGGIMDASFDIEANVKA